MSFIIDSELDLLLQSAKPPLLNAGPFALSTSGNLENPSQVQPCSIDLRIDDIFLPGLTDASPIVRTDSHSLGVGESIRVSTIEVFALPSDIGALLFAPARVTRRGVLVPDIGHVDPGFDGKVRLTLINVGKHAQMFAHGDVVATTLLFRLQKPVGKQFEQFPGSTEHYSSGLKDVNALSKDFLRLEERTRTYAREEATKALGISGWKYSFWQVFAPILLGLVVSYGAFLVLWNTRLIAAETKILDLDKADQLTAKVTQLELEVRELRRKGSTVEAGDRDGTTPQKVRSTK